LIFIFLAFGSQDVDKLIDIEGLRSQGDDWQVMLQKSLPEGGSIKLQQDKWLMYFLHWRPLTEERQDISIEYVRKLMLSFWGPNMPFALSQKSGEMKVAGHRAFFIDGTIYQGMIHSRFIVWNCPETKRQFISDCNINLKRGAPEALLDLQREITQTIACHPQAKIQESSLLRQKYASEKYKLSFYIPQNWRTNDFNNKEWFPKGLSDINGSLWTLLTDSEKYVELLWDNKQSEISEDLFKDYIKRVESHHFETNGITWKIIDMNIENIEAKDDYIVGEGAFKYHLKKGKQEMEKSFIFKALLWNKDNKTYFLLASLRSVQEFWQIPVDLSPSREIFNKYLKEEVLANIKVFNKSYK